MVYNGCKGSAKRGDRKFEGEREKGRTRRGSGKEEGRKIGMGNGLKWAKIMEKECKYRGLEERGHEKGGKWSGKEGERKERKW